MVLVRAVHTFVAEHGDELEFSAGEEIQVLEKDDSFGDGWWRVSEVPVGADNRDAIPKGRKASSRPPISQSHHLLPKYITSRLIPRHASGPLPRPRPYPRITMMSPSRSQSKSRQTADRRTRNDPPRLLYLKLPKPLPNLGPPDDSRMLIILTIPNHPELGHQILSSRLPPRPSMLQRTGWSMLWVRP